MCVLCSIVNVVHNFMITQMTGRVVIVTGADRGVGFETARYLAAEGGYDVILACRDQEKGQLAVQKIRKDNPSALVTFMQVQD